MDVKKKNIQFNLVMSIDDKEMLKILAKKLDCSESYVIRRAIKLMYDANTNCHEMKINEGASNEV